MSLSKLENRICVQANEAYRVKSTKVRSDFVTALPNFSSLVFSKAELQTAIANYGSLKTVRLDLGDAITVLLNMYWEREKSNWHDRAITDALNSFNALIQLAEERAE